MYGTCILILSILLSGCAGVFDFVIPKHSNSKAESPELMCARFIHLPPAGDAARKELGPLAAEAAMIAIGVVIDQVAKGLEAESKLYKATYSGRTSSVLLNARKAGELVDFRFAEQGIKIQRFYGELPATECPGIKESDEAKIKEEEKAWEQYRVMQFEAKFEPTKSLETFRIIPTLFELKKTKAKVSWFSSEVDMNIQITLTGYAKEDKKSPPKQVDLAQVDFPMGKMNISKRIHKEALGHLASGSIAVPTPDKTEIKFPGSDTRLSLVPINATITVMESDDFGDIIGKSAKTLTENKAKILDELGKLIRGKDAK